MTEEFKFIPFEDVGSKFGNYTISLAGHSGFGFNSGFYNRENIKQYSHVLLSYDKTKKAIGFFFTNDSTLRGACKITHTKSKKSGSVVVRSFFTAHNINPEEYTGKYTPKEYEDPNLGKLFYIILEKNVEDT